MHVFILQNHGLIACGPDVEFVSDLVADVERRLTMPVLAEGDTLPQTDAPDGFSWAPESWAAHHDHMISRATAGSYYPDHVVFLGPALPHADHDAKPPAIVRPGEGILLRDGATSSQKAMLRCVFDVLSRVSEDWEIAAIGASAEAELLDWDAEKYRQALAARA